MGVFFSHLVNELTDLAGDLLRAVLAVGVGLLGDPLAALVGVGEQVPRLLVEVRVAPGGPRLRLAVDLAGAGDALVGVLLAQPETAALALVHLGLGIFGGGVVVSSCACSL